jgi:predicted nucleic acid-binding Zn ribbon protein
MTRCPSCETINDDDAEYCTTCRAILTPGSVKNKRNIFINFSIFLLILFSIIYLLVVVVDLTENFGIDETIVDCITVGLCLVSIILLWKSSKFGLFPVTIFVFFEILRITNSLREGDVSGSLIDFILTVLLVICIAGGWKSLK